MDEVLDTGSFEQSPEVRQRFGDWVRSHASVSHESDGEPEYKSYSLIPGCLDIPATSLAAYNDGSRLQIEFFGEGIGGGQEALMTLLQDDGGTVSLYVNKPRQINVSEKYLKRILDSLESLEQSGDITPLNTEADS